MGFELVLEFTHSIGLDYKFNLGAVAQLGERLICIQEVAGSIPTSSTRWYKSRWHPGACSSGG
jgi:hypothetical protein